MPLVESRADPDDFGGIVKYSAGAERSQKSPRPGAQMSRRAIPASVVLSLLLALAGPATLAGADQRHPRLETVPPEALQPAFNWDARTYAARCQEDDLMLKVDGANRWKTRIAGGRYRGGSYRSRVSLGEGQAVRVAFKRKRRAKVLRFRVRCLPLDFPEFGFRRFRPGGPGLFSVGLHSGYATIFSRFGAPIWWYKGDKRVVDAKVLPDGTVSWNTNSGYISTNSGYISGFFEIRTLTGDLLRTLGTVEGTDLHDIQLLPNGNYMLGTLSSRSGVDTVAFGGRSDVATLDTEIQEVTADGQVLSSWDSGDHLMLAEAGRWWDQIPSSDVSLPYDVSHWNSVEPAGKFMYLSFRNLDAVYKVNRKSGRVVWKLGGTETGKSLRVLNYPNGDYPLGAQHDARLQPDGTITVFNNRTDLSDATPVAQRFRIDEDARTARLVETVRDRKVTPTFCCGSARRLPSGDWLVSWGNAGIVGAYNPAGRTIFRLFTPGYWSYRADPVPPGRVTIAELGRAMDAMNPASVP